MAKIRQLERNAVFAILNSQEGILPKYGIFGRFLAWTPQTGSKLPKLGWILFGTPRWSYERTKSFTPSPRKMDFWPKNGQILPITDIFGQISAFLDHLVSWPTKKWCEQGAKVVFQLSGYQNFYWILFKLGFLAQERPILALIMHLWSFTGKY